MPDVTLRGISKSFGTVEILHDINLEVKDGEFCVFVGPSGCGKTTLLRIIAGLETIGAGELSIGGRLVNELAPAERRIAMVFQSYALYPHMTVYRNIAFGLKFSGGRKAEVDAKVRRTAEILHLTPLLNRKPREPPRPAPAGRHRPGHRARAQRFPLRRAAVQSGCGAQGQYPHRDRQAPPPARRHHDLCHP
jgi:ABC-type sugar transport system ATPase subunit